MIFFALSGLINGLSATLLGVFVLTRRPESSLHRIYALFCLAISVWSYSYFQWLTAHDVNSAAFWARALMAGAIFIPITAFHHLVKLINKKISLRLIEANYVFSTLLFLMLPRKTFFPSGPIQDHSFTSIFYNSRYWHSGVFG